MGAPTTAITRFDLSMTLAEFNARANRLRFIGLKILPIVVVGVPAAEFLKLPADAYLTPVENTERAPKSGYARDDFNWTKDSFAVKENGVEEVVDDATIDMYGDIIRAEFIHAERVINRLLQALEQKAATAIEAQSWSVANAAAGVWTDVENATPIDDVDTLLDDVEDALGLRPNAFQISARTLRKWSRTDQVKSQFKTLFGDDAPMGRLMDAFKATHELEHVFVSDGMKNGASKGQTTTFSRFWDPAKALAFYHSPTMGDLQDPMPSIGKTIFHSEQIASIPGTDSAGEEAIIVEEYREEARRGGVLRGRFAYQQKLLMANAGGQLTGLV